MGTCSSPTKCQHCPLCVVVKHKYKGSESLNRYKARLVANGRSQQQGIDCDETFSPVVKPATIRTVLSLAVSRQWPIHQLDSILMALKQPFGAWFQRFSSYVIEPASSTSLLQRIISLLHAEFAMTDLGPLNYFLGISCHALNDRRRSLDLKGSTVSLIYNLVIAALPDHPHLNAMKHVLCYLRGTTDLGLQLLRSTTSQLIAYSDADWAGHVVSFQVLSETDTAGVANAIAETSWIRNLLRELHTPLFTATLVYCDNQKIQSLRVRPKTPAPTAGAY
ncbi:ribonuclease H-like domain-containing protein [Tanacetum coccineum]